MSDNAAEFGKQATDAAKIAAGAATKGATAAAKSAQEGAIAAAHAAEGPLKSLLVQVRSSTTRSSVQRSSM